MKSDSDRSNDRRPVLLMVPGPVYLFWTTGVFYLWLLSNYYKIVLAVPASYKTDANFIRIVDIIKIHHLAFFEETRGVPSHYGYASFFSVLVERICPDVLLVHSRSYLEDLYAIHFARALKPDCIVVAYQNGRSPMQWGNFVLAVEDADIRKIVRRWKLPYFIAALAVKTYRWSAYHINNTIMPRLVVGRSFAPFFNVHSLSPLAKNASCLSSEVEGAKDFFLCYMHVEARNYQQLGYSNVIVVSHPVSGIGTEVMKLLFDCSPLVERIIVLPSFELETCLLPHDATADQMAGLLATRWVAALEILHKRMPTAALGLKIHPRAEKDPVWVAVLSRLRQALPDLVFFDSTVPAVKLIVESTCVVSDVSSTLWWAMNLGGKIVISLDIFGYRGGDEMRMYDGLVYVDNISSLSSVWLNKSQILEPMPSVSDFVCSLMKEG